MGITDLAPMHDIESSDIKYLLVKKFRNAYVWVQDASFSDIYASKRANERREPFLDLYLSLFLSCCFYPVKVVVIFNFSTLTLSLLVRHTLLRGIPPRQWSCITSDLGVKSEASSAQSNFGIPANQRHGCVCRPCCSSHECATKPFLWHCQSVASVVETVDKNCPINKRVYQNYSKNSAIARKKPKPWDEYHWYK